MEADSRESPTPAEVRPRARRVARLRGRALGGHDHV